MSSTCARAARRRIWPEQYAALRSGLKTCEFRKNDRDFQVGDVLLLREWDRGSGELGESHWISSHYTEATPILRGVTHVLAGPAFGIPEGYALLSLAVSGG